MSEGITVLSLFDGISCGKLALERAGIKVSNYFSSEIAKNAIKVSSDNHNDIIQIGDIHNVSYKNGVLVTENGNIVIGKIDLIIGGSPCQSFSQASAQTGNMTGLDGKSKLFYQFLRVLNEVKSENEDVKFLLENVRMKSDYKDELDSYLGVNGVYFNSELVSFQRRPRYYWANWKWDLPVDLEIDFQDYKEKGNLDFYKANKTKSRIKMWSGGVGIGNSMGVCANITNAKKIYCVTTKQDRSPNSGLIEYEDFCRYLTRGELELSQTLPLGYTDSLSYNQMQQVVGNGWTVDAVSHIFSYLKEFK